jgi:hypothetical protein
MKRKYLFFVEVSILKPGPVCSGKQLAFWTRGEVSSQGKVSQKRAHTVRVGLKAGEIAFVLISDVVRDRV